MKRRILSLALALTLALALAAPARAFDMGKAGEYTILSCGGGHTAAIDANGGLWTWGYNYYGQLGDDTTKDHSTPVKVLDNVAAVSCGGIHTAAIKTDGSLWMWGDNDYGELGDGTTTKRSTPVKVLDNVAAVSCGDFQTAAIKTDGSLWMWGDNGHGQLGDGTTTRRYTPVKVLDNVAAVSCGSYHTAAIKTDGSLWTWGLNNEGELGDGTTTDHRSTPVKVLDNVAAVSCGDHHTAAIKTDGSLWMWGVNTYGELGFEGGNEKSIYVDDYVDEVGYPIQTSPVKVLDNAAAVSCGCDYTAAVKTDGSLWTWGSDECGQLGYEGGNATDMLVDDPCQTVPKQVTGITEPQPAAKPVVVPTAQKLTVNGTEKNTEIYNIDGSNYFKLRDMAALLNGTGSQFSVGFDGARNTIVVKTGEAYAAVGGELATGTDKSASAALSTQSVEINGEKVELTAYNIGGNNFFKLRELGTALGFGVDYDAGTATMLVTSK